MNIEITPATAIADFVRDFDNDPTPPPQRLTPEQWHILANAIAGTTRKVGVELSATILMGGMTISTSLCGCSRLCIYSSFGFSIYAGGYVDPEISLPQIGFDSTTVETIGDLIKGGIGASGPGIGGHIGTDGLGLGFGTGGSVTIPGIKQCFNIGPDFDASGHPCPGTETTVAYINM